MSTGATMTQTDPSINDVPDDDPRGLRDFAEREAQRARTAESELANLRTQEAFRNAGLDPQNPLHQAVINGYTGELSGVGDFVTGLGLTNSNRSDPLIPTDEQAALERARGLLRTRTPAPPSTSADGEARLRAITMQAVREKWGPERFNQEFTEEMRAQNRPVANMDIVVTVQGSNT